MVDCAGHVCIRGGGRGAKAGVDTLTAGPCSIERVAERFGLAARMEAGDAALVACMSVPRAVSPDCSHHLSCPSSILCFLLPFYCLTCPDCRCLGALDPHSGPGSVVTVTAAAGDGPRDGSELRLAGLGPSAEEIQATCTCSRLTSTTVEASNRCARARRLTLPREPALHPG